MFVGTDASRERADASSDGADHRETVVAVAIAGGVILAILGVIDGVVVALQRTLTACPDGTYFPPGAKDFRCYSNPQLGLGVAIAIVSILLGILILLCGDLWRDWHESRRSG